MSTEKSSIGSSRLIEEEWDLVASHSNRPLISIDCSVETSFCANHGIISLPVIRLFRGNENVDGYRGPRTSSEISSYVSRSTLPALSILTSANLSSFKSIDKHVFLAYLHPNDQDTRALYEEVAARNHHLFTFGLVTDFRLANVENVPFPSLVAYSTSEGKQETFTGEWRPRSLEAFIEGATTPLLAELTRRNEIGYLQGGKSLLYIFAESSRERTHYRELFKPLAKKYNEYISFVTVDAVEYVHMAPGLGIGGGEFPAIALLNPGFGQVFPYSEKEIGVEGVESWVLDIVGGRVKPWTGLETGGQKSEGSARDEL